MISRVLSSGLRAGFDEGFSEIISSFCDRRGRAQAEKYILGLLSPVERKNGWQLAEQMGDSTPYKVQQFLYRGRWSADEVRDGLRRYVVKHLGESSGVLVLDETGFLKQGVKSAGVKRQYSGTAGRIENCQIGVFLSYAGSRGHSVIDRELYIPREWADDTERREQADIPSEVVFHTKPELGLEMIRRAHNADVAYSWVTADSVYGESHELRGWLEEHNKGYVLSVSGKAYVWQGIKQWRISAILKELPEDGWQRISAGRGTKGERFYDWISMPLNPPPVDGFNRCLLVRRSVSRPDELRAYICCHPCGTHIGDLVRVAGLRWTVEMCFAESKSEVGLDQYEVRSYSGWYKHITLSCFALALLSVLKA